MKIILEIDDPAQVAGIQGRLAEYNAHSAQEPVDEATFLLAAVIPLGEWATQYAGKADTA